MTERDRFRSLRDWMTAVVSRRINAITEALLTKDCPSELLLIQTGALAQIHVDCLPIADEVECDVIAIDGSNQIQFQ